MADPPEKLALNVDQTSESSLNLSWQFIRSHLAGQMDAYGANFRSMMQLSPATVGKSTQTTAESEPVDGFVLAFAKHPHQQQSSGRQVNPTGKPSTTTQSTTPVSSAKIASHVSAGNASAIYPAPRISQQAPTSTQYQTPATASSPQQTTAQVTDSELQWQAIQLSPQVRQHNLKNLDCGTQYALKIWAFNKVGKGEPSDLLWTSTRGKGKSRQMIY